MVYKAHVELSGNSFDIGTGGDTFLSSPGGVEFTLHHTGSETSNPETGHIARFLYSLYVGLGAEHVSVTWRLCGLTFPTVGCRQ